MAVLQPKLEIVPEVSLQTKQYVVARARRGEKYFIASCPELGVFTQGETLEELKRNLREAVDLSLADGENEEYGLPPSPAIWLVYEEAL
ncbi:MAG TPA: type II toxin-antitoxin system HicB family antitoxin [Anaerolineae bacterium]|nr:type II toxin-antitoxin system HicB family antitoxin [Anaerolineae bacterium]